MWIIHSLASAEVAQDLEFFLDAHKCDIRFLLRLFKKMLCDGELQQNWFQQD